MARFLVIDENLPGALASLFEGSISSRHVNDLKKHGQQRVTDDQLRKLSLDQSIILITKDDDFVRSWVSRKVPPKVIFVYFEGKKEALLALLETYAELIMTLIEEYDFIEVSEKGLRLPFEIPIPYEN